MRFQTVNALSLFNFEEVTLREFVMREDSLTMVMDALIVKGNNPVNEECIDRFADTANLCFKEGKLTEVYKEGYKYYDAMDRLIEEVPDEKIPAAEYEALLKQCRDVLLFDIIRVKEEEELYEYQIGIDLDESTTYWFCISCKGTIMEWEKFKNRVMNQ